MNPVKKAWGAIYLVILAAMLTGLFGSTFNKPPRSDYWTAFYYFHRVAASPGPPTWLSLANYDPWQHGTFRPVSHLVLYLQFRLFNPWFTGNRLTNFAMYLLSIALLFLLADQLKLHSGLTAVLLTVYAFLYSHFDIVTWTFQIFSTSSFSAFLLGFILHLKFLKTDKGYLLFPMGLLFLYAMLSSEVYAFWPVAVMIPVLGWRHLAGKPLANRSRTLKLTGTALLMLYLGYAAVFYFTRTAAQPTGPLPRPTAVQTVMAATGVFFNLAYNGLLVNLLPFVSEPTIIQDNIDMGGLLVRWYHQLPAIIIWGGLLIFLNLALGGAMLFVKNRRRVLVILSFLFFLYFSNLFVVTFARLTTNEPRYVFSQFRYQYIPNGLMALMLAAVIGELWKPTRKNLLAISLILLPVLTINFFYSRKYVNLINQQLSPLGEMLENIRLVVEDGAINPDEPLFIDPRVTGTLPSLCWNEDMAIFIRRGTYEWFFPPSWMPFFVDSPRNAAWVIPFNEPDKIYRIAR